MPTISQVVAKWEEGSDTTKQFKRSIMVCGTSREPQYIKAYHGCYDPLLYPLFSLMVRLVRTRKYCMQTKAIPLKVYVFLCDCDFVYRSFFPQLLPK
jgi:hypothetical protein